mmetsp:Transcript_28183/g.32437  ORF Transcript_28183/g.32437 Transcript_28183/m.32437 type:complete len:323 (+) Transcript_28183:62-1030(+)|eukprot:CAMPEP_0194387808 /NCGR_PEP_ID=MMETSP0174-20130528/94532_1 /TAXON_ID=216777 /ORGANISM="Proboscia alata, Strain PI-D3" /LENGTH=322 /DNA_ID=CAMNT_0039178399 /DNA_START=45 /DNA_END=1013 /DNA_ORIENTATION=-
MSDRMVDFAAGTAGGFAGKLLDYPFDTVKVLLQTQSIPSSKGKKVNGTHTASSVRSSSSNGIVYYRGAIHCLRHTIETKGFLSLYRGLSSPLLGSMAENALLFAAYNTFKEKQVHMMGGINNQDLSLFQLALAGAGAGACVPFVLTPVELIKCRLQVQNHSSGAAFRQYKGPIDVCIRTIKTEGLINGLYRGNTATLLREIPGNFCWYGVYEGICMMMTPEHGTKADLGTSAHLLGGALAGVAYWTAFYPADTVKSRMQTQPEHLSAGGTSSFFQTFLSMYRTDGVRGLYRGWGITVARAAPATALIFATYEYTLKLLKAEK